MKLSILNLIFFSGLIFMGGNAYAYPQYIRLGYHSCLGCHYNAEGGGMLTPYGKGIASTQSYLSSEMSDESLLLLSEKRYLQAFQARVLNLKTNNHERTFPMQVETLSRLEITQKWSAKLSLAVSPKPKDSNSTEKMNMWNRIYARQFEVVYAPVKNKMFSLGISPLPLGLGLVDHTQYVRANNRLQITDIPFNFKFFENSENASYSLFGYLPHYLETNENKESGFGSQYWYRLTPNMSLGTQMLYGASKAIHRTLTGVLFKAGLGQVSLLAEGNYTHRKLLGDNSQFGQITYLNQLSYHPLDYLALTYSLSGLSKDREFNSKEMQHSLSLQSKISKNITLSLEGRIRIVKDEKNYSQLLQGFFQWW